LTIPIAPSQYRQSKAKYMTTLAHYIIAALQQAGTQRLFGMPGGGSNADLLEAAHQLGLPFTLAHTETAAAFMASAQAEVTGKPGACLATLGPGTTSVMNGVAHAWLDRIPLIVLTDCHNEQLAKVMQHQTLPQLALFKPITKWNARLQVAHLEQTLQRALTEALSLPAGPVQIDCGTDVTDVSVNALPPLPSLNLTQSYKPITLTSSIEKLLRPSRRPLFLLGLGARTAAIAATVRELCEQHGIPALVTYKAKGIVPDQHPWFAGVLTHGALERPILEQADLFIAIGLDPVELLAKPWTYPQPIISLNTWPLSQHHVPCTLECVGDVVSGLQSMDACLPVQTDWDNAHLQRMIHQQREAMRPFIQTDRLLPHRVVELIAEAYPQARVTVDAGAHMFPTMALWPACEPHGMLISNGLATMGFALPAAIGAALLDTTKPTLALTGDGGLLMCTAELHTAAREQLPLRVIVFDDHTLSLIKIKQVQRGYHTNGVDIGAIHWIALGEAMGMPAFQVSNESALEKCLRSRLKTRKNAEKLAK
jgi:acetolactate synthase-1/2/3 large subunit